MQNNEKTGIEKLHESLSKLGKVVKDADNNKVRVSSSLFSDSYNKTMEKGGVIDEQTTT